ncbi:MAG: hypothetical protein WCJ56_10805 [bacterium]
MAKMQLAGVTPDEMLAFSDEELNGLIFCGKPVVFTAGTAEILGEFRRTHDCLTVDLAHIDGGGEGVLPSLWLLADQLAQRFGCAQVEWIVHAVFCARPNLRLRRVLERKGFTVQEVSGIGQVYYLRKQISEA